MYKLGGYYLLNNPVPVVSRWVESRPLNDDVRAIPRISSGNLFMYVDNEDVYFVTVELLEMLFSPDELTALLEDLGVDVKEYYQSLDRIQDRRALISHCCVVNHVTGDDIINDELFTLELQSELLESILRYQYDRLYGPT